MPAGVTVRNLTNLHEIEADSSQSTVRVPGLGSGASMTDMSAFDPTGRYIFLPHETQYGAGLTRYDTVADKATNLFHGDMNGSRVENGYPQNIGILVYCFILFDDFSKAISGQLLGAGVQN